nr:RNA-directed DNA polymerase, eukaryota, reverse transcriptase zinc-binding domain protein [Tanacetum cinerariifolium]
MLRESFHDYGPIPFMLFYYWFEIDGFEKMILKAWCESPTIKVNPMLKLMYKMKFLKKRIRELNGMRQSSKSKKSAYKKELHDLKMIIDQGNATDDMLYKRMEIIKAIQEVDKADNMEAAQKAKIKCAIEGDENTKYYHGILNKKRNQLAIRGVLKDGIWIENPNLIDMESDVSYQEIKRAVWDCGVDKSSGPDGFTFGFIRRFWSLLEKDVVAAVKYFFTSGTFPKGCNASFIALILKILDAKMVKDFSPISLIGSLYKIIAKILANHFVGVLGDIVSEVQLAFVADRQILDGPFILNEIKSWDEVMDKMVNRLSKWKMKTLSIGGLPEREKSLKEEYPRLYALEVNKNISVASKFTQETFASSFRRLPRSGVEFEQWRDMLESLDGVLLSLVEDRWKWVLNGSGVFTVASARQYIDN